MDYPHPADPQFEERVRSSFAAQAFMTTLGARLTSVTPGEVSIELTPESRLTQQHGFVHAGVVTSIADSACGYAAFTLMPADHEVLSVEFKVNLLRPAVGDAFHAHARVIRAGRTLSVCQANVVALASGNRREVATMLATILGRPSRSRSGADS